VGVNFWQHENQTSVAKSVSCKCIVFARDRTLAQASCKAHSVQTFAKKACYINMDFGRSHLIVSFPSSMKHSAPLAKANSCTTWQIDPSNRFATTHARHSLEQWNMNNATDQLPCVYAQSSCFENGSERNFCFQWRRQDFDPELREGLGVRVCKIRQKSHRPKFLHKYRTELSIGIQQHAGTCVVYWGSLPVYQSCPRVHFQWLDPT